MPHLIVSGSIAIDRIMNFSGKYQDLIQADKLDVISLSVLVDGLTVAYGGTGGNIAYNAAALGDKPILLGGVGNDAAAYITQLTEHGVDTTNVETSELATASFTAFTDGGNNQIGGFYPGAMRDASKTSLTPWAGQEAIVCLSANDPDAMRHQVQECGVYNLRLFYDPGQQVNNISADDLRAGIAAAEVLAVNEYEHGVLLEKLGITDEALVAKVPLVIITQGERGSYIRGSRLAEPLQISSAKPAAIVDPTGAGDAYRAGFLYGYLRQWDVTSCAQLGSVMASFVLEQAGTQVPITRDVLAERYKQTYNKEITF